MKIDNMSAASIINEFAGQPLTSNTAVADTPPSPGTPPPDSPETPVSAMTAGDGMDLTPFFDLLDEKLFKENILIPFNNEDGSDYVRPKSMDELVEVVKANTNAWIENAKYADQEAVLEDIFSKTTPAFQFLAQHANQFTSIEEMLPLMQSVQTQDQLAELDVENEEHQEFIISSVLGMQGLDQEAIMDEIQDLRERGRLGQRAEVLKPTLDRIQADNTQRILHERALKAEQDKKFWDNYYNSLNQTIIQAPEIYGLKINKEDKIKLARNLIPSKDGSGLPLYHKIDEAIGEGRLDVLAIISLMLETPPENLAAYYANQTHAAAGQAAARTLRTMPSSRPDEELEDTGRSPRQRTNSPLYGNFMK